MNDIDPEALERTENTGKSSIEQAETNLRAFERKQNTKMVDAPANEQVPALSTDHLADETPLVDTSHESFTVPDVSWRVVAVAGVGRQVWIDESYVGQIAGSCIGVELID